MQGRTQTKTEPTPRAPWARLVPREVGTLPEGARLEYAGHHGYVLAQWPAWASVLLDSGRILDLRPDDVVLVGCLRRTA